MGASGSHGSDQKHPMQVGITLVRPNEDYISQRAGIGVTCLGGRFQDDIWPYEIQESTAREYYYTYTQWIQLDDKKVKINLYDDCHEIIRWPVSYVSRVLTNQRAPLGDTLTGVAFCYDCTDSVTWDRLKDMIEEVLTAKQESEAMKRLAPELLKRLMIVGLKCDLTDKKEVDFMTVQGFANQKGLLFIETSAKENVNVDYAFISFAAQLIEVSK